VTGKPQFHPILKGPPYDCLVEESDEGGLMVIVALARESEGSRVVSVVSELFETVFDGETFWEFSFSIDVFCLDDSFEAFRTQERAIAAPFIPVPIRDAVMKVVCSSLESLVTHAAPRAVYWVTKDRNPHDKALPKYHMVRETLENMGYSVTRTGTDRFSRRFWTTVRKVI
jgi:hypothetical protein